MRFVLPAALGALLVAVTCLPMRAISEASFRRTRDWFLLGMLAVATLAACRWALPFAPLGVYFLARWRDATTVPSLVVWLALGGLWAGLGALPWWGWAWVAVGWLGVGTYVSGCLVWEYLRADRGVNPRWHPFRYLDTARAWFGQRTLAAAFLALLLPFFPGWSKLIPLAGLLVTCSWTALLGALGAMIVLEPRWAIPAALIVALVGSAALWWPKILWLTPRGNSLDSVGQRVTMCRLLWRAMTQRAWWPWGYGPRSMTRAIMVWAVDLGPAAVTLGNAHMEPGQFAYEYGPLGVLALALLGWQVLPALRWGDPWSAAWVAGALVACGALPCRAVSTGVPWLAISAYLAHR